MSFQTYLSNIEAQTGKTPADFRALAEQKEFTEGGKLKVGVKAGAVVDWLKSDFELGHGHAMAIWALLSGKSRKTACEPPDAAERSTVLPPATRAPP